jgi:anti-sigma factor RsiW
MFGSHVTKKLSAYLHGELPPPESARVAAHLVKCGRCRGEYEEIKFGASLAEQLTRVAAPASLWSAVESQLDAAAVGQANRANQTREGAGWHFDLRFGLVGAALAAVLLVACVVGWRRWQAINQPHVPAGSGWAVERVAGLPKVGASRIGATGQLQVGQWLETDGSSRATLKVADIGEVEIEENSRVRLLDSESQNHRIELARGRLSAMIWAPPRLFFVETPSATAVDLGCAYTLDVDEAGASLLRVTLGYVSLVSGGRESYIPAGAVCETRPGVGPGTPHHENASPAFRSALRELDFGQSAAPDLLKTILAEARADDALTLWHLLARVDESLRGAVYDRLAQLAPPPVGVTREGAVGGDRRMLDLWWQGIGYTVFR